MATSRENIERGLAHLGLGQFIAITACKPDRVYGRPTPELEQYCKDNGWYTDPACIAGKEHGKGTRSYREPDGVHPAMQICFHPPGAAIDEAEIDYDYAAPEADVESALIHVSEVLGHAITHGLTNQDRISRMLDERFSR